MKRRSYSGGRKVHSGHDKSLQSHCVKRVIEDFYHVILRAWRDPQRFEIQILNSMQRTPDR